MALDKRLLEILCCPVTKQPVLPLNARQLEVLRKAQQEADLQLADGSVAAEPVEAGLITRDGKSIYLIADGIPVMLADQAVPTSQFADFPT
jgi:uncharacterized protein YbaR (Trm112 family)